MRASVPSAVLAACVLVAVLGIALAAQEPLFKGGNRTVAVYATVSEVGGHLVPDLAREDFRIQDEGKDQELTVFANDRQPITVVMLLDRSGSMRNKFELVAKAAEAFVDDLGPDDKARIGSFSNRIQLDPRNFTSDHDEMREILHTELQEEGPTPLWNAVNVGITALLHQEGRRVILVFTDGVDEPLNQGSNNSSLKDVMKRAEEENVMVYAIGLAGNTGGFGGRGRGGSGGGRGGGGGGHGGGPGGFGHPGFALQYGGFNPWGKAGASRGREGGPDPGLAKIAEATGGGYFELFNTTDLNRTFKRVAEELHHQYLLGFSPNKLDGKMHRLDVKVTEPTYTVRARKTYLAADR